ncbi:MAG: hypothetical protein JJ938_10465 [Roseicyclus sp.]|nr:hypothetical protein [Roseicyclus sp.]MBO6625295.1 hypothetical protein [Roseicyclus sp.]MBO6922494.1 hypothetical protein [Roseicyclus sp.]
MAPFELVWDRGIAQVEAVGAMLGPVRFHLSDGRTISPLAVGPWGEDGGPDHDALPPILKRLRGEWPCVPFGAPDCTPDLPERWRGVPSKGTGTDFHGYGSHNAWECVEDGPGRLVLEITYPEDHAIAGLRREIRGVAGKAELEISLMITARTATCLPIALHPVFALPRRPGEAEIVAEGMTGGHTFPGVVEPGVSRLAPDLTFESLEAVPTHQGPIALSRLPLPVDTEELVQLFGVAGRVTLCNHAEAYEAWIAFDQTVFPSVLLWVSNRGRRAYPWNGRFTAVGIEPLRGAFDLGPEISSNPANPIARSGIPTALELTEGEVFTTSYQIGAGRI